MSVSVWSCGGGLQSAAIAALIVMGRLPKPDYAVIADTGYEKSTTWAYLETVLQPALLDAGVNLVRVLSRDFATVGLFGGKEGKTALIPGFTTAGHGVGKLPNFCSYEWKRRVVERYMRVVHDVSDYVSWIGFSLDEAKRVSQVINAKRPQKYPLVELGITRDQCHPIVARMGWPTAPRSSCYMCPNQSGEEWRAVMEGPDREKAIVFDKAIRKLDPHLWLTQDAIPLDQVNFDSGQGDLLRCESGECFV